MVAFWLIVFVIALGAVVFVARPLLGETSAGETAQAREEDEALAGKLAELKRDLEFGMIDAASAAEAEREAREAAKSATAADQSAKIFRSGRFAAFAMLGVAPLVAVLSYLVIGTPEAVLRKPPAATADNAAAAQLQALEDRVISAPDDFDAWMTLGTVYANANRASEAVRAFARAVEIVPDNADAHSAFGESLVLQANGAVVGEARNAFERAIELAPGDPRARFYLAEARYQVGDVPDAVRRWAALLNDSPPGAPWFGAVAARMTETAAEAGVSLGAAGLTDTSLQRFASVDLRASDAPEEDFEGAVGRIEAGAASFEDWLLAAATYAKRGETDRAGEILDQAEARYEGAPFVIVQIKTARGQLERGEPISASSARRDSAAGPGAEEAAAIAALPEDEQRRMIEGMVAGLAARLEKEPGNLEGWRMLGRSYRVLGRPAESAAAWREYLARAGGDSEDWRQYAFALLDQRPQGDNTVSPDLESALARLREFNADDPLALYHLGIAARDRGDLAGARTLWLRLKEILPPESPLAPTLDRLLQETSAN